MARRRKDEQEHHSDSEEQWSIKRIFVGIVSFLCLALLAAYLFFPAIKNGLATGYKKAVLGASDKKAEKIELPDNKDVTKIIQEAQKNLSKITPENLTASDAAITKIIQDLQALQGGKKNAGDIFCELVCKDK